MKKTTGTHKGRYKNINLITLNSCMHAKVQYYIRQIKPGAHWRPRKQEAIITVTCIITNEE